MTESGREEVCRFLLNPATHGVASNRMQRIDTHIAIVVLAGDRAYKLKRAVRLPFLDFTTLRARREACQAEIELNRRTAPEIYLKAMAITREADGSLAFEGRGETIEWVVAMRRFDDSQLLDRLAMQGKLSPGVALNLANVIADFHESAEPLADGADGTEMQRVMQVNDDLLRQHSGAVFDRDKVDLLANEGCKHLDACWDLLAVRCEQGFVRRCHGDLHLRNIFLEGEQPVIFDAIEFDDRLANTDVIYDLAFLLMDLVHRGLGSVANLVLNRYLLLTGDDGGLRPLPLFLSIRAAIRAHVSATMAQAADATAFEALRSEARQYLALALDILAPARPCLVAIGGYSGSGKSTLARQMASEFRPLPGAIVIRSDEIRKHLFGVAPESPLQPEAYAPHVSGRVYGELRRRAAEVLKAGYPVIADAVHDRSDARLRIADVARKAEVEFAGIWLGATEATLAARIGSRDVDASDATADVMRQQVAKGSEPKAWFILDAEKPNDVLVAEAVSLLRKAKVLPETP